MAARRHYEIKDIEGVPHKWCNISKTFEPVDNFGLDKNKPLGLHQACRLCRTKEARSHRLIALQAYSGNTPKCSCCGQDRIEFLALDHINGGGNKHRKEVASGCSTNYYRWLRRNNWPGGFQVLCHNCNLSRGVYGYCPCQREQIQDARQ